MARIYEGRSIESEFNTEKGSQIYCSLKTNRIGNKFFPTVWIENVK